MTDGEDTNDNGSGNVTPQDAFWMRVWTVDKVVLKGGTTIGLRDAPDDQRSMLKILRTGGSNPTWQLLPLAHTEWLPDWGIYLHDNGADQAARFDGVFYLDGTDQGFHTVEISIISTNPRRIRLDIDPVKGNEIGRGYGDAGGG